jgi:hypothetical protein
MAMKIDIKKGYPHHEVSSIIKSALIRDAHIAEYKKKDDRDDYFDWFAAKKGFDVWDRRLQILAGVNVLNER